MPITLYGIKNCDTIKKARRFMDANEITYHFHDYRADGVDQQQLQGWISTFGWETVLNKRGTTWRKLPEGIRNGTDGTNAAELLIEQPAMIKRPILVTGKTVLVGFNEGEWTSVLL